MKANNTSKQANTLKESVAEFPNLFEVLHNNQISIDTRLQKIESILTRTALIETDKKPSTENYFNTKLAADFINKTPNALRVMVCKGKINSIKKDGSLYFLKSDLIEWLESGRRSNSDEELIENCLKSKK